MAAIVILTGLVLSIITPINMGEIMEYIIILFPLWLICISIAIIINYFSQNETMIILIRIVIVIMFVYSLFYFLERELSEASSFFLSTMFWGSIFMTSFLFKNRIDRKINKDYLKRNWYEVNFPVHIFKNGNMILERNYNFVKSNLIEVIFVDKNFQKIDSKYDQMDFCEKEIRRVKKLGKIGFIDNKTKEIIIETKFDCASDFHGEKEPVSCVKKGDQVFLINIKGQIVPHFD